MKATCIKADPLQWLEVGKEYECVERYNKVHILDIGMVVSKETFNEFFETKKRTMKKILAILIMLVALLTSCDTSANQEEAQEITSTFREVNYKGHSYIMFKYCTGYQGYAGLTHNPDCPCKKGGEQ